MVVPSDPNGLQFNLPGQAGRRAGWRDAAGAAVEVLDARCFQQKRFGPGMLFSNSGMILYEHSATISSAW